MHYKTNYWLIAFCILAGCTSQKKEEQVQMKTLHVNLQKEPHAALVSKISSIVQIIPLSTDNENLIGEINKIIYENNFIYISDGMAIYKYSLEGELLSKLNKRGEGVGEYISITDFQVNTEDMVWILDRNSKSLNKYNWDNELKTIVPLNDRVNNFYVTHNDAVYLYIGNETDNGNVVRLKCLNLQTKNIIQEYLEIDSKKANYLHVRGGTHFHHENDSYYFFELFNDTVYSVSEKGIYPEYYIDFDNKNIPASLYDRGYENIMEFFQAVFSKSYPYGIPLFAKANDKCIFTYYYNQACYMYITDENSQTTQNFSSLREDKLLGGYPIHLADLPVSVHKNKIILPALPSEIVEYAKENLSEDQIYEILQKIKYKSEDQNPVILMIDI